MGWETPARYELHIVISGATGKLHFVIDRERRSPLGEDTQAELAIPHMVHCQLADHHGDMKLKRPENRIREVRQALGISQEVLGERLGTDGSQIHKLENGKLRLTLDWMVKIAEALGCDLADLLPVMPNTKAHARADLLRRIDLLRHLVEAEQFATAFQSGEVMMRNLSAAASKFPDVKE